MTRLIDADALKENAYREGGAQSIAEMVVTVSDIDDAPTVDAVPVIRCKDCKFHTKGMCLINYARNGMYIHCGNEEFCCWAERKEELDCNDCYYSMQNCNDRSICCEDETALCDDFKPVAERSEDETS